jgi:hypothetical protein
MGFWKGKCVKPEYKAWIAEWLKTNDPIGKCSAATLEMQKVFPELIRVRGHYYVPMWSQDREHWWLKTKDEEIVDPTAKQFPMGGTADWYTEWEEGREEPIGKCMNCGDEVFKSTGVGDCACSKKCHRKLLRSFG